MKRQLIILGICMLLTLAILFGTDPKSLPAFMLIVPFVLVGVSVFMSVSLLLTKAGIAKKKVLHITVFATALPLILLGLQSVGQLTTRDVLTLGIIFLLSYFYVSRMLLSK